MQIKLVELTGTLLLAATAFMLEKNRPVAKGLVPTPAPAIADSEIGVELTKLVAPKEPRIRTA
ncbi:hypothetical protein [Ruegeria sp. SCP11]|uniref:hypothetical protein n=1 Tax=Ruegeria sp. SCP11 TaxID=3141378 RepID=UPI003339DBAF